ncbi:hypothetical protein L0F63_005692, partial [Massospora cicadina]
MAFDPPPRWSKRAVEIRLALLIPLCTPIPDPRLRLAASHRLKSWFSTSSPVLDPFQTPSSNRALAATIGRDYLSLAFYQFTDLAGVDLDALRIRLLTELNQFEVDRLADVTSSIHKLPFGPNIEFNFSTAHKKAFERLRVKVRQQIKASGKKPLLFDVRNQYEHAIGHFEGAILPDVDTFKEGMDQLIKDTRGHEKEEIFMYCTGGIRCSKAGAILRSKGFEDVKMLKGGITAYGNFIRSAREAAKAKRLAEADLPISLFRGQNFTFDKKLGEPITDEIMSNCSQCGRPTVRYTNCCSVICHVLFLQCPACAVKFKGSCGSQPCLETPVLSKEANLDRRANPKSHADRVRPKI